MDARGTVRGWARLAGVAAAAAALAVVSATPAQAVDLQGNARFTTPGVRVFDDGAVSSLCTRLGFCDEVSLAAISRSTTTRKRSDRADEPVQALCAAGDMLRVQMFGVGAETLIGWVSARQVRIDPGADVGPCGLLQ